MVFSENMGAGVKDRERVSPLNLRQSIRKLANGEQITLFCIDRCRSCYIMRGRGDIQKFEVDINFGMDFKVYTLDRGGELTPIEDFGRVEDRKVCSDIPSIELVVVSKYVLSISEGSSTISKGLFSGKGSEWSNDFGMVPKKVLVKKGVGFTKIGGNYY